MTREFDSVTTPSTTLPTQRFLRGATAIASTSGLLVGLGAVTAAPAFGATAADCSPGNTVTANGTGSNQADIQLLLDADADVVVCLEGTFVLTSPLTYGSQPNHDSLTLFGLTDAVLDGNSATQIVSAARGSDVTVQNLTLRNGVASDGGADGGAVRADYVTAIDSNFEDNTAVLGGAISAYSVEITDSTFVNNTAGIDGGAVIGYAAVSISNSTFLGNSAGQLGGAVAALGPFGTTLRVVNSTFVGNDAADEGGAIFAESGSVLFSTFLNNTSAVPVDGQDIPGEALYLEGGRSGSIVVRGNVFAGDGARPQLGIGTVVTPPASYLDLGGNVFSTSALTETDLPEPAESTLFSRSVSTIFGADPQARDNGGPTPTVALVEGSPAIDAVTPFALQPNSTLDPSATMDPAALADVVLDQRGVERAGLIDAGAYEYQAVPELAATGGETATAGWLAGIAALLLGAGAAVVVGARIRPRAKR